MAARSSYLHQPVNLVILTDINNAQDCNLTCLDGGLRLCFGDHRIHYHRHSGASRKRRCDRKDEGREGPEKHSTHQNPQQSPICASRTAAGQPVSAVAFGVAYTLLRGLQATGTGGNRVRQDSGENAPFEAGEGGRPSPGHGPAGRVSSGYQLSHARIVRQALRAAASAGLAYVGWPATHPSRRLACRLALIQSPAV